MRAFCPSPLDCFFKDRPGGFPLSATVRYVIRVRQASWCVFVVFMALIVPDPVRASDCISTGSLSVIMMDCTPAVAGPEKPGVTKEEPDQFDRDWTLRIRAPQGDWHSSIRASVALWVEKRLYPNATKEEQALMNVAIQHLAHMGFPLKAVKESDLIIRVNVTAKTLNKIAATLDETLRRGHLAYHVSRVIVAGGSEKENQFAAVQLSVPEGGIVDSDFMSAKLYALSQIPGLTRADGMMVPAIATRNVSFSLPHILIIHSDRKDWAQDIRRQVFFLVANLVVDMKNPLAKKIVTTLSGRLSRLDWPLLKIQKEAKDTYRVEAPSLLLNTLKNILLQAATLGRVSKDSFIENPKGQLSTGNIFAPLPKALEYDNFLVHLTPTPTFSGSQVEIDNYGYAPTGAVTLNAIGNVNNALLAGGLFTVGASTTFGGMNSGSLGYSFPIGLYVRAGMDFSAMNYRIGLGLSPWGSGVNTQALTALGVSGSNYSGDLWTNQAIVQKEDRKLVLKETVFLKEFQDSYSPTVQNDRSLVGGILDLSGARALGRLNLSFDLSDTEYDLSQGSGSSPVNPFYYDTQGFQNYVMGNGQVGFAFTPKYSMTLGTVDQQYIGGGTLDPMLQATLGGMANVMALPTASLFGNNLYVGTLTFTRTDSVDAGAFYTSGFFDAGEISGIGTSFSAMGPGVEESFSSKHFFARIDAAVPVGPLPVLGLGNSITALTGGNIGQGGIPIQLWLSIGLRE